MTTAEILAALPHISALVVGDICLDRWCTYDPDTAEPSRETGIPRVGVVSTEITPGAGGTVANNLAALGVGRVGSIAGPLVGGLMLGFGSKRFVGKPCAPIGNLPAATHTEPLDLLSGYTEFRDKLRVPRSLGEPPKEAVSLILDKREAGTRCFAICRAG